jgi:hypothetical protein
LSRFETVPERLSALTAGAKPHKILVQLPTNNTIPSIGVNSWLRRKSNGLFPVQP